MIPFLILRTRVGIGYVMQHDWGLELGASGRVGGLQTDLNSFFTVGDANVEMPSGSLTWRRRTLVGAPRRAM
jgi:hypothetical protein